jgi:hypothetical protein
MTVDIWEMAGMKEPEVEEDVSVDDGSEYVPLADVTITVERPFEEAPLPAATMAKYGKPPVYSGVLAMFPRAILELARVSEYGATKHEVRLPQREYMDVPEAELVYKNAEARHLVGEALHGPINVGDGGVYVAAQRAWNALADLEILLRRLEDDELPF